jgi:hypothetical protein
MKHYFRLLTTAVSLLFSVLAEAQESKFRLREFAPKYKVDTFYLHAQGLSKKELNRTSIEGVKSFYFDETSAVLTVQYNERVVDLDTIKNLFKSRAESYSPRRRPERANEKAASL